MRRRPTAWILGAVTTLLLTACSGGAEPRLIEPTTEAAAFADESPTGARSVGTPQSSDEDQQRESVADGDPESTDQMLDDNSSTTDTSESTNGNPDDAGADAEVIDAGASESDELDASADNDATESVASEPGRTDDDEDLDATLDELIQFVETERGRTFSSRPEVVVLDDDAFVAEWSSVVAADVAASGSEYADWTDIYRALGIIEPGESLDQIWSSFGDAGILGWYDAAGDRIVLRTGEITPFTRTLLVHELTHALDDESFDVDADRFDGRDDELGWTFRAVVEGSAIEIEERYRATLSTAELEAEDAAAALIPRGVSFSSFTDEFLEIQFSRSEQGAAFIDELWDRGGAAAVDAVLTNPPSTSEQIMNPELWVTNAPADIISIAPVADGAAFRSGVLGEARLAAILISLGIDEAYEAASGWGGDGFVAWRAGEVTCVRIHLEADTPAELDGYASAFESWAAQSENRDVFYPTADLIRVTSCG